VEPAAANLMDCPSDDILEQLVCDAGSAAPVALRDHARECPRCRQWVAEALADEGVLSELRAAWAGEPRLDPSDRTARDARTTGHLETEGGSSDLTVPDETYRRIRSAEESTDRPLPEIPGYVLHGLIGEGGMGRVYEAEQENPRRRVAIKLMRGRTTDDPFRNRLIEREAAALARLRHHGIAAIHGAGRTRDGLNYFVMEQVHGERITEFGRRHALSIRTKLELFQRICLAIHHAHQRGVIHGDLKPGNILVETLDSPKVLDFGLARMVDEPGDGPRDPAAPGPIRGTPAYMSPEQAAGRVGEIDYRTDIFSLGAVLYELLTGGPPLDAANLSAREALARAREGRIVPAGEVNPALRGDVDAILARALSREPEQRYADAGAFAEDIGRYLARRPVAARRGNAGYRALRFVQRHALVCTLASLIVAALAAFGIVATIQKAQIARESRRATQISRFLQQMIADLDPGRAGGTNMPLRNLLDDAARRIDAELGDDPESAASLRMTLGEGYTALGLYAEAESQLTRALELRRGLHGDNHPAVAECHHYLAEPLKMAGRYDDAEPHYAAALEINRRVLAPDDPELAHVLNDYGAMRVLQMRLPDAEAMIREAVDLRTRQFGEDDPQVAIGMGNLASVMFYQHKFAEGEPIARRSLEIRQRHFGENDPGGLTLLSNWCAMIVHLGADPDTSLAMQRDLLQRRRRVLGPTHPDVLESLEGIETALRLRGDAAGAAQARQELNAARALRDAASNSAAAEMSPDDANPFP